MASKQRDSADLRAGLADLLPVSRGEARQPILSARGLRIARGRQVLLRGIDLDLARGELVTLVGPNGAGKSTLIKILCGVLRPDDGRIRRQPGLRCGYVPQRFQVDDNLPLLVGRFLTLQLQAIQRLEPVVAATGIEGLLERPLQGLSGGESRRVLLVRALLRNPDLLFLDEPAAGLDIAGQTAIYELVQAVRVRFGCGILVASHDLHLAVPASDQVVCLDEGRISCRGEPVSVQQHPAYRALFGQQREVGLAGRYTRSARGQRDVC